MPIPRDETLAREGQSCVLDWPTVETEVGAVPPEIRSTIETWGVVAGLNRLEKQMVAAHDFSRRDREFVTALQEAARWRLPLGKEFDPEIVPVSTCHLGPYLQAAKGVDVDAIPHPRVIDVEGEEMDLLTGITDLYHAAETLNTRRDNWFEGRGPQLETREQGPDALGNICITACHEDRVVLETIDTAGLPVTLIGMSEHRTTDDHTPYFKATFKHGRYSTYGWLGRPWDRRTQEYLDTLREDAGIISARIAPAETLDSGEVHLKARADSYEEVSPLTLPGRRGSARLYRYISDGVTRWVSEWVAQDGLMDRRRYLIFWAEEPDTAAVSQVLTTERVETALLNGSVPVEFNCYKCGGATHWLDLGATGDKGIEPTLHRAEQHYCGC